MKLGKLDLCVINDTIAQTIIGGQNFIPPPTQWDVIIEQIEIWEQINDDGGIIDFGDDWPILPFWDVDPFENIEEQDDESWPFPPGTPDPINGLPTDGHGNIYYI